MVVLLYFNKNFGINNILSNKNMSVTFSHVLSHTRGISPDFLVM